MSSSRANIRFENDQLFYVVLLLAVAPLWLAPYLPGIDIPGHVATVTAVSEIWRNNPVFTELFEINWFTPYLAGMLILYLLALVMPVGIAVKVILSIVIIATPILTGRLLEAMGGDPRWKWLTIPSTYSFAFYWGFFPFLTAVPLGLVLILLTFRFSREPTVIMGLGIAAYSILLFFSHLLVLGFSSMLALAWLAGTHYRHISRLMLLSVPYTASLPFIALWMAGTQSSGTYMGRNLFNFGPLSLRLQELIVQPSGLDGKFFAVSLIVTAVIIGIPIAAGAKLTKRPERWAMAVCGFATFMIFPAYALGTAFLYQRFGLYLPLLWFILWEKPAIDKYRWHWIGMVAVILWATTNVVRFATFSIETREFDKIRLFRLWNQGSVSRQCLQHFIALNLPTRCICIFRPGIKPRNGELSISILEPSTELWPGTRALNSRRMDRGSHGTQAHFDGPLTTVILMTTFLCALA